MQSRTHAFRQFPNHRPAFRLLAMLVAGGSLALARSASAGLDIVATDVGSTPMNSTQAAALEEAIVQIEALFDDPITVNIDVSFSSLSGTIIASANHARCTCPYDVVWTAMRIDAEPGTEREKVEELPDLDLPIVDINGARDDDAITMSTANAKALGLGTGLDETYAASNPPVGVDAEIKFSSSVSFDYDRSDGISSGQTDFIGVAMHEITHALGFFSLTDVQDNNPNHTLHSNTLDIWRFPCSAGSVCGHVFELADRQLTAASAHFDTHVRKVWVSSGLDATDSFCNAAAGACQAHHWRDDQGNLMDPSLGSGVQQDIQGDDVHALDYIGYSLSTAGYLAQVSGTMGVMPTTDLWGQVPDFGNVFEGFPAPPPGPVIDPPPGANVGFLLGLDLGLPGEGPRTALGYMTFTPPQPIDPEAVVLAAPPAPGSWEVLDTPRPLPNMMPPALHDVYFVTESTAGPRLTFRSTASTGGIQRDLRLGEFGGYRITGVLDGEADGVDDDVDAVITLVLLADELGVPLPMAYNLLGSDPAMPDNNAIIYDEVAFAVALSCPADVNGDGIVNVEDLVEVILAWGTDHPAADVDEDGDVGVNDLIEVIVEWGPC